MEKEKTRGRTRRKQPSQVASFLYREGRRWFAAVLSLCLILNNMTGVTWAAQTAGEKEIWFKLTSSSLYEALQEAVRDGEKVNDHFLFEGKENDVEAYEKLLLLDDDLYELKPEFENKDEVEDAETKKNLQLRIFASLGWEIDPEKEYQVAGDEKIIFYLSNGSETEQTAVIQVDEKTTEDITVLSKSAVVIGSENKEESLEAETEEVAETRENEGGENETGESETGESEGQAAEENSGEDVKKQGSGGNSGALSGGNGGNSENSPSGNGGNSGNSGSSTKTEISAEGGSFAGSSDEADKAEENKEDVEGEVQENPVEEMEEGQDNAENEERADSKGSTDIQESIEHQGGEQGKAEDSNSAEEDKTNSNLPSESEKSEKPEEEGTEDKKTESVETGNKEDKTSEKIEEDKASEKIESEKTEDEKQENVITENTEDKKSEKSESSKSENADSEKPEKEKTDAENAVTGKSDQGKEESGRSETVKSDNTDKQDRTDKEPSKMETSGKNASENTKADKEEKTGTGKSEKDNSGSSDTGSSDNLKTDKSNHSDSSSDNGKEIFAGISRNAVLLVTDNLEESDSEDASTVDNDSTAVTASPSNIEDDEIEGELYEPVVIDEETVIVFVTTAEELGLNRAELRKASPSNAERISPAFEKEVELENVIVQVKADENVLPEGVQLQVKELKEEGEHAAQYEEAKEALDSQGTEYDGMMALDISFLDNIGKEIEPDGNVQVSIKVKKEALPEEADLESITVQHLAEEEGKVFVEEVADSGNKTEGKVEVQEEEHVEAEFEVDSFSTFTVTWKNSANEEGELIAHFTLKFYSIDSNGTSKEIDESSLANQEQLDIQQTTNIVLSEYFGSAVRGYNYIKAEFNTDAYICDPNYPGFRVPIYDDQGCPAVVSKNGDVEEIQIKKMDIPGQLGYQLIMKHSEHEDIECDGAAGIPTDKTWVGALNVTLKLYYNKNDNGLGILDTIKTDGLLKVDCNLEQLPEGARYAWYKWAKEDYGDEAPKDENGKPILPEVEPRQIAGSKWNMDEKRQTVNVALDGGANHYYQVALLDAQGRLLKISSAYLVPYFDQIQNSSFEDALLPVGKNWVQYPNGTPKLMWKSTTGNVEIVRNNSSEHNLPSSGGGDKNQCAELNPQESGALYQDVLTVPGSTLHWKLLHRARGGEGGYMDGTVDTMHVLIMPTALAEQKLAEKLEEEIEVGDNKDYLVNQKLNEIIAEVMSEMQEDPTKYPGVSIMKDIATPNTYWKQYGGDYLVADNQYLTRFFFIAGEAVTPSRGNLIDDVWFGTKLPDISIVNGTLSVTKIVKGLASDDIKDYKIELKITSPQDCNLEKSSIFKKNEDGTYSAIVPISQFEQNDTNYSKGVDFTELPPGLYTIEEILSSDTEDAKLKVTMKQVDENGKVINSSLNTLNKLSCEVNVRGGQRTFVEITNEYPENSSGTILPDTGGPGLAMFERYGWFLLMLALFMAGVEVRCYGERKYRRASVTQSGEFDAPL